MQKIYRFTHLASYLSIISGVGYWIISDFMKVKTEYGLRPHPFQNEWQGFHILVVPLLLIAFGMLWDTHIVKKIRLKVTPKKKTGWCLFLLFFVMVLSGYLIQVSSSLQSLDMIKEIHELSSLAWSGLYIIHHFLPKR